jgi:hypothetical protein
VRGLLRPSFPRPDDVNPRLAQGLRGVGAVADERPHGPHIERLDPDDVVALARAPVDG